MTNARVTLDPRTTQELLIEKFDYDKERGLLLWKNPANGYTTHGAVAGTRNGNRGRRIRLLGKSYLARYLIWYRKFGTFSDRVMNLDNDVSNDRLDNLGIRRLYLPNGTQMTQGLAKVIFRYDPETGRLVRIWATGKTDRLGEPALVPDTCEYQQIRVFNRGWKAHRLIWLMVTGKLPVGVDHINGDRSCNKWSNLREVTQQVNCRNIRLSSANKSGTCGVCWNIARKKWQAAIKAGGKNITLIVTTNKEEAIAARKAAEIKYNFHPNHGLPQHERDKYDPETD